MLVEQHPLAGRRVLVTGASGFVGERLVERLSVECGATVRVLVRTVGSASALSRFPVEVARGDVRNLAELETATRGCEVVFHCARGTSGTAAERRAVDVDGTRNLLEAASRASVRRVVHVSTVVVYDIPRGGELDEQTARSPKTGDLYTDAKSEGERIAVEYGQRIPVTVIQPTVVYGPRAGVYGRDLIEELQSERVILVDGGRGICNAVYIDDLVTALLLAATRDRAAGETFLVSGPEYPTWAQFFGAFEQMLGLRRTVGLSGAEAIAHWRRQSRRSWLLPEALRAVREDKVLRQRLLATREGALVRRAAERVLPASFFAPEHWVDAREAPPSEPDELPLSLLRPQTVRFLASTARVRIDKARELLGYRPIFGLAEGMQLTEAWARWEGLLREIELP